MTSLAVVQQNMPAQANGAGFSLQPANMQEAMQVATMIAGSQLAPKDFKGKKEDTLVAMMMGSELGLNPMQAIQNIAVINGRPCVWGDAMLALVQNHPAFKSIEETFDEETMSAKCTVTRKGGKPHTEVFSKEDATRARLWDDRETVTKNNYTNPNQSAWYKYPKRMLAMRARGFALRNQFADALLGLITTEEAQDIPQDEQEITATIETEIIMYPEAEFENNLATWKKYIAAGKKTADEIIATVEAKGKLTDEQKKLIKGEE